MRDSELQDTEDLLACNSTAEATGYNCNNNDETRTLARSTIRPTIIMSITESRGIATKIGYASINLTTAQCYIAEFPDTPTYARTLHEIYLRCPTIILLPDTLSNNIQSNISNVIYDYFSSTSIQSIPRKWLNHNSGMDYLSTYGAYSIRQDRLLKDKRQQQQYYYGLSTLCSLFKYLEEIEPVHFLKNSIRIQTISNDGTMLVDMNTAVKLNILQGREDFKKIGQDTLISAIDQTSTKMGARLLKVSMMQPLTDQMAIESRLDCVQYLTEANQEDLFFELGKCLSLFSTQSVATAGASFKLPLDMDAIIAQLVRIPKTATVGFSENRIYQLLLLRKSLQASLEILKLLQHRALAKPTLLSSICDALAEPAIHQILNHLEQYLVDEKELIFPENGHQRENSFKTALGKRHLRCFSVKPNLNSLLNVARTAYNEGLSDLYDLADTLSSKSGLPIQTIYRPARGFLLSVKAGGGQKSFDTSEDNTIKRHRRDNTIMSNQSGSRNQTNSINERLPSECIQFQTSNGKECDNKAMSGHIIFTTLELLKLNERIKESLSEIYLMSDKVIGESIEYIRERIYPLFMVSEAIGLLDMLYSFASYAASLANKTVRPDFHQVLAIKDGRHPILANLRPSEVVANPVYCCPGLHFQVITGLNQSGKSTYLHQIALLQILAQMGCYVPANYASFRIFKRLLLSSPSKDDLYNGTSTFLEEMNSMALLFNNRQDGYNDSLEISNINETDDYKPVTDLKQTASANGDEYDTKDTQIYSSSELEISPQHKIGDCLVLLDELGRGTSISDGITINMAICEELIGWDKPHGYKKQSAAQGVFVFMTTWLTPLIEYLQNFPSVVFYHMATDVRWKKNGSSDLDIHYSHSIQAGPRGLLGPIQAPKNESSIEPDENIVNINNHPTVNITNSQGKAGRKHDNLPEHINSNADLENGYSQPISSKTMLAVADVQTTQDNDALTIIAMIRSLSTDPNEPELMTGLDTAVLVPQLFDISNLMLLKLLEEKRRKRDEYQKNISPEYKREVLLHKTAFSLVKKIENVLVNATLPDEQLILYLKGLKMATTKSLETFYMPE